MFNTATTQQSAHDVSRIQPQKKFIGSQAATKVMIQKQKDRPWIQSNSKQSSEKRTSDTDKQERQRPKCPQTSAKILDIKRLQPCGVWIRTCERECLCKQNKPVAIPRVVHFIKDDNLTFSDWLAVIAAKKYIKPTKINLFTRDDISPNCWMRRLHLIDDVNIIGLTAEQWLEKVNNVTVPYVEHQSDLLRNAILYHYGGIYMDTDAFATKSFDSLLSGYSVVLGQNLVNKTGNGLILARRQSCLMCDYALLACDMYDGSWIKHSTVSLSTLVQMNDASYNLLLLSNTSGFFPFSWKQKHFYQLFDLNSAQVSFSPTQVYALHLFGSKFPEEIMERFSNLTWINESPSILASHVRTLIHSQLLKHSHLNETVCINLPPKLLR